MTTLKESSNYQLLHGEGIEEDREEVKIAETRRILIRLTNVRFGKDDKSFRAAVEAIDDLDRLEKVTERLFSANSRRELIDQSQSGRN